MRIPPNPPLGKGGEHPAEACDAVPPFSKGGQGGIPGHPHPPTLDQYAPHLRTYARQLRTHQTDAETRLWDALRRDQLGTRFYRQRPLGPYILDFYAPKARLVVELDGSQHRFDAQQQAKDAKRDEWLQSQGIQVLRFDDRQVLLETKAVIEVIFSAVQRSGIPPSPPLQKGGVAHPEAGEAVPPFPKGGAGGI
ncbi:MAG: DUF559 domain-containing protein [Pseudomonadota bacterium]